MRRNLAWLVGVILVVALLTRLHHAFAGDRARGPSPSASWSAARGRGADDVREAVFRYEIRTWGEGVIFLSLGYGQDPSDAFMARFAELGNRVRKASHSYLDGEVRDRVTGESGVTLTAAHVKWVGLELAEVEGGYVLGGLAGEGGTFVVALKDGRWTVVHYHKKWISSLSPRPIDC